MEQTLIFQKKCPVILYDKNDKEIKSDEIELSDKKIRVNVNVLRAKTGSNFNYK